MDSLAAPLDSTQGLFVWTPDAAGLSGYAVTCQAAGQSEDLAITPGGNSLVLPVTEVPALPRPVYQRTLIGPGGAPADVYTLWTSDRDTPFFPAMCNRPGEAYDLSVHRGTAGGGLLVILHVHGGSFYLAQSGSGTPGEWQITVDDFIRAPAVNTFWFGYHEGYDIEASVDPLPPISGTVTDYTARRTIFTLEWARRDLPVDTSRVYVAGGSMGAIGGVFLAMWRPDLIAAAMLVVPLFDFSFQSDPNPLCQFNEGAGQRLTCDRLWGTVATGLRMEDGTPVYDRLNAGFLARQLEARYVPPIIAFSGRNDVTLGWAEKIPFYRAMRESRAGGTFFWDNRSHVNTPTAGAWWPTQSYQYLYLYRFRTDLSFPALSNCSADGDPGDGNAADGDSIGTINGFVEWDSSILDEPGSWQVRLALRNLRTLWGTVNAPESLMVDVTPRRLQAFTVSPGAAYAWKVSRSSDGATVQSDVAYADELGVLTMSGVKIYRAGSMLSVGSIPVTGVGEEPPGVARPRIAPLPSPLRSACRFEIEWPRAGEGVVDLLDTAGRRVGVIFRGRVERGHQQIQLDPGGLPCGVYSLCAREGGAAAARCVAVVR